MDDHICTPLCRADDQRGKGIVHNQHSASVVGNGGECRKVCNDEGGIAEGFRVDNLGVGLHGLFHSIHIINGNKRGSNVALGRQEIFQKCKGATIYGVGCDNVIPRVACVEDGCRDGSHARGDAIRAFRAFHSSQGLAKLAYRGAEAATIQVAPRCDVCRMCGRCCTCRDTVIHMHATASTASTVHHTVHHAYRCQGRAVH